MSNTLHIMYNQSKDVMIDIKEIVGRLEHEGLWEAQHFVIFRIVLQNRKINFFLKMHTLPFYYIISNVL